MLLGLLDRFRVSLASNDRGSLEDVPATQAVNPVFAHAALLEPLQAGARMAAGLVWRPPDGCRFQSRLLPRSKQNCTPSRKIAISGKWPGAYGNSGRNIPRTLIVRRTSGRPVRNYHGPLRRCCMSDKPSIVFAHGLWADGSCFGKVIKLLLADGFEVIATQNHLNTVAGRCGCSSDFAGPR